MDPHRLFTYQTTREIEQPAQLMELVDQSLMPMAMVLRTMSKELERSSIDSISQTTSSQPKTSTTPTMATSQVTLERPSIKPDPTTSHHTSTQSSVTASSEPTPVSPPEVTVPTLTSSTKMTQHQPKQEQVDRPSCKLEESTQANSRLGPTAKI